MAITYKVKIDDDGTKLYYNDKDQLHREDGPAIEDASGLKRWYLRGIEYTEEQFIHFLAKKILNDQLHITLGKKPMEVQAKI